MTLENIKRAVQNGKPFKVKVLRSSGKMDDDWMAMGINNGNVVVMKFTSPQDKGIDKVVCLEDLQKWNS